MGATWGWRKAAIVAGEIWAAQSGWRSFPATYRSRDDALLLVFRVVRSVATRGPVVSRMAGVISGGRRHLVWGGLLLLLRRRRHHWTGLIGQGSVSTCTGRHHLLV